MTFEVVDGDERPACCEGEPLAEAGADQEAADQPGAGRRRDSRQIRHAQPGRIQHRPRHAGQMDEMRPRGDFRDDTAERGMVRELAENTFRQYPPVPGEKGDGRLVTGGFDRQNRTGGCTAPVKADVRCSTLFFVQVRH